MFGISPVHLIIVLIIVLVIFGPSRLPQLGESLGKTIRAIREGSEQKDGDEAGPAGTTASKTSKPDEEE
jgi:sec-independent protein translocase protein TatA